MKDLRRRRFLQKAAGALLLSVLPACGSGRRQVYSVGERFPEISLPGLDGHPSPVLISGKPHIINFWATWCKPCRNEMAGLQKLSERYAPGDLQVAGVTIDDDLNLVREFLRKPAIAFPQFSDRDQKLSRAILNVAAIPVTYFVGRDRRIVRIYNGERDWDGVDVLKEIETSLGVMPLATLQKV